MTCFNAVPDHSAILASDSNLPFAVQQDAKRAYRLYYRALAVVKKGRIVWALSKLRR
jgi:hypothetical protein